MAGRIIGNASDFYRLRITRIDLSDEPDLEWRDDILYREPPRTYTHEAESWALEAVNTDDEDDVTLIASFETPDAAHEALDSIQEELLELTKSAFEKRYFTIS